MTYYLHPWFDVSVREGVGPAVGGLAAEYAAPAATYSPKVAAAARRGNFPARKVRGRQQPPPAVMARGGSACGPTGSLGVGHGERLQGGGDRVGHRRSCLLDYVTKLEAMTGKKFGDPTNPLLVSTCSRHHDATS